MSHLKYTHSSKIFLNKYFGNNYKSCGRGKTQLFKRFDFDNNVLLPTYIYI